VAIKHRNQTGGADHDIQALPEMHPRYLYPFIGLCPLSRAGVGKNELTEFDHCIKRREHIRCPWFGSRCSHGQRRQIS
jgi:hypothetical protein